jgi:signal transduction histidine kinase
VSIIPEDRGMVILCRRDGTVVSLLRDDLDLAARVPVGSPIAGLVDSEVQEKFGLFLAELQGRRAAYDWEITALVDGQLRPLHFAGAQIDGGFLVVVGCSRRGLTRLNEELMLINNEQTNALRAALKELSLRAGRPPGREGQVFDDLSRLNNELANLHRELARKNVELQKLNEQKNRFLGMAAHDLRSPLGVILNYAEFLETEAGPVLNEEQREFVTTIKDTSQFMLTLVEDLLDVSTIESGQLRLNLQPVDLVRLVARNVALNRALAAKKEIAVEFEAPAAEAGLDCDAGKIEQVLNNLIGNAVKFSHRGTRVQVRLTGDDAAVTIAVADHGQGIPAAELPRLFRPFSKISVRSTAGEQSTGLGLAICRKVIEGHGGRIRVESEVGKGSTFFVTLPRHR